MRRARTVTLGLSLCLVLFAATWIGGARAAPSGGDGNHLQSGRQLINVIRGEHIQASYRRCLDEQTRFMWPDVRDIPAERILSILRTWENRLATVRAAKDPRAVCWQSHLWAESWAGRCVSSKEGGLRSVSSGGVYFGKWQADLGFQRAYGAWFYSRWGVASNWDEWAQDVMAYRGYQARGWWPWPSTARQCGLL